MRTDRVAQTIPNMIQGVSQQPVSMRRNTQAQSQDNSYPSVSTGQLKRPPSEHKAKISSSSFLSAFTHSIVRDSIEQYEVVIIDGDLKVFDLDGNEKTVTFPDGKSYLTSATPKDDFKATTVADYTFIANQTVTIAKDASSTSPSRGEEVLLYLAAGRAGKTYKITIGSETSELTTGTSGISILDTSEIMKALVEGDSSKPTGSTYTGTPVEDMAGVTVTSYGNVIHISKASAFTVEVEDGDDGEDLRVITKKVQQFSDLPPKAPTGYTVEVQGDDGSSSDNYYVKNTEDNVWEETVAPDNEWSLDATTLPHTLVSNADGTFTFAQADWVERYSGDSDTNPDPSFVDKSVSDIFFFKNRLGITADESIIMSENGSYFNFYRTTVMQLLDSDPIDVQVTHTKVSKIKNAIPFNDSLVLFSDNTQFRIDGGDILSPKSVSITPITEYQNNPLVRPIGLGRNLYFTVEKGSFSSILEYYLDDNVTTEITAATEITEHVPKYIPGGVTKLIGTSTHDMLMAISENERDALYVYKYFWQGNEKVQSSWVRWKFDSDSVILNADFVYNSLSLVIERPDGVYLETINLDIEDVDDGAEFKTRLDRRVTEDQCSVSYDPIEGTTTFTLPYEHTGNLQVVTRYDSESEVPIGSVLSHTIEDDVDVVLLGDHRTSKLFIGVPYTHVHEFSQLTIKAQSPGGGLATVTEGRLMIQYMSVVFDKSGYFKAVVEPKIGGSYEYVYTGRKIGVSSNRINHPGLDTGDFRFPVKADAKNVSIKLINESFLPSVFNSAEWEGRYVSKARRI